jgi:hypothetical protein
VSPAEAPSASPSATPSVSPPTVSPITVSPTTSPKLDALNVTEESCWLGLPQGAVDAVYVT